MLNTTTLLSVVGAVVTGYHLTRILIWFDNPQDK